MHAAGFQGQQRDDEPTGILAWWFLNREREQKLDSLDLPLLGGSGARRGVPPKNVFALERTYLAWIHMAITVGAVAAALVGVAGGSAASSEKVCFPVIIAGCCCKTCSGTASTAAAVTLGLPMQQRGDGVVDPCDSGCHAAIDVWILPTQHPHFSKPVQPARLWHCVKLLSRLTATPGVKHQCVSMNLRNRYRAWRGPRMWWQPSCGSWPQPSLRTHKLQFGKWSTQVTSCLIAAGATGMAAASMLLMVATAPSPLCEHVLTVLASFTAGPGEVHGRGGGHHAADGGGHRRLRHVPVPAARPEAGVDRRRGAGLFCKMQCGTGDSAYGLVLLECTAWIKFWLHFHDVHCPQLANALAPGGRARLQAAVLGRASLRPRSLRSIRTVSM